MVDFNYFRAAPPAYPCMSSFSVSLFSLLLLFSLLTCFVSSTPLVRFRCETLTSHSPCSHHCTCPSFSANATLRWWPLPQRHPTLTIAVSSARRALTSSTSIRRLMSLSARVTMLLNELRLISSSCKMASSPVHFLRSSSDGLLVMRQSYSRSGVGLGGVKRS